MRHLSNCKQISSTCEVRYFPVFVGTFSTQSLFPKLILTLIWYISYNLVFYYNLVYFLQFGTYKPWLRHLSNCKQISSTSEGRYLPVLLVTCKYFFSIFSGTFSTQSLFSNLLSTLINLTKNRKCVENRRKFSVLKAVGTCRYF